MQKIFIKRLSVVIIIFTIILIAISYFWLVEESIDKMYASSKLKMDYIEQALMENVTEIETLRAATQEDYLNRADAVAHMLAQEPEIIESFDELMAIADLMNIDEINVFDENGVIIAATVPVNIGSSVNDGDQIGFFKAILEDPSAKLVQEILSSSIDGRMMQYSGVAREDKKGIIEIGMQPQRMLNALERTSLSHVISEIATDAGEEVFVLVKETGIVKGSTNEKYNNINFYESGLNRDYLTNIENERYLELKSKHGFSIVRQMGDYLICTYHDRDATLDAVQKEILLIALCLIAISTLLVFVIIKLLKKHVIKGINEIIGDLSKITEGNLEIVVETTSNPEFKALSNGINTMVQHLLKTTAHISQVIEAVDVDIGVYEYRADMKKVLTTDRLAGIIGLSDAEEPMVLNDKDLFEDKLLTIQKSVRDDEGGEIVYCISSSQGERYIKINSHTDSMSTLGIVVDVTEDIRRQNNIINERDHDALTGLYNRKAFVRKSNQVFSEVEKSKVACILMVDMDNLKYVNDTYGHKMGDKYIKLGADTMQAAAGENGIVARLGGDEFALLWYGYDDQKEILKRINQMETAMHENFIMLEANKKQFLSFSAGYVFYPEYDDANSSLLHFADLAMYQAKQNGKGRFQRYDLPTTK